MSQDGAIESGQPIVAWQGDRRKNRRLQTGVRTLIVLVGCCGLFFWAARQLWESRHPSIAAARGLKSRAASERMAAIRELERTGISEREIAIPPLIVALRDTDPDVRIAAADVLKTLVSNTATARAAADQVSSAIAAVIELLNDQRAAVRIAAVNNLPFLCASKRSAGNTDLATVIAALTKALADPDDDVRLGALHGIGVCGPRVSGDPPPELIAAMDDHSTRNREAAVVVLASYPRNLDPWIPVLLRKVEHDEPHVHRACAWALCRLSGPPSVSAAAIPTLIAALAGRVPEVRCYAAIALGRLGSDAHAAIGPLVANLREPRNSTQARPGNSPSVSAMKPMNGDPVLGAAYALGKIAPGTLLADDVIKALCVVLRTDEPGRRQSAVNALGNFGAAAAAAVPDVIKLLKEAPPTDNEPSLDGPEAARALGLIAPGTRSDQEVVALLTKSLQSKSFYMRLAATDALARFGPKAKSAIPHLDALLKDPHGLIKEAAAKALIALGATE